MNYIEWKNTFKKYLYLLPIKEEKETLAYFDEQYNKLNPKDLDNVENIFSDPIDKAAFVVAFYLEMEDEIKKNEENELLKKALDEDEKKSLLFFNNIGNNIGVFFDSFSMQTKKRKAALSEIECLNFEKNIQEKRLIVKDERNQKILKFRKARLLNEEKAIANPLLKDYDQMDLNMKYYTRAERHSFLTNFMFALMMSFFVLIGVALTLASAGALIMTIFSSIYYFLNSPAKGGQLLVDVGYIILIFGAIFLSFGISLGILLGSIKSIHSRFFVKRYIMLGKKGAINQ